MVDKEGGNASVLAGLLPPNHAEKGELEPTITYTLTKREAAEIAAELGVRPRMTQPPDPPSVPCLHALW